MNEGKDGVRVEFPKKNEIMNAKEQQTTLSPGLSFTPVQNGFIQRKWACSNKTIADGGYSERAKKKNTLQRKLSIGVSNDPLELETDRIADQSSVWRDWS